MDGPDLNRACFGRARLPPGVARIARARAATASSTKSRNSPPSSRARRPAMRNGVSPCSSCCTWSAICISRCTPATITTKAAIARSRAHPESPPNTLHHHWDTEFVARLGANEAEIARRLLAQMTDAKRAQWSTGTPEAWAMESWSVAKRARLRPVAESERAGLLRIARGVRFPSDRGDRGAAEQGGRAPRSVVESGAAVGACPERPGRAIMPRLPCRMVRWIQRTISGSASTPAAPLRMRFCSPGAAASSRAPRRSRRRGILPSASARRSGRYSTCCRRVRAAKTSVSCPSRPRSRRMPSWNTASVPSARSSSASTMRWWRGRG